MASQPFFLTQGKNIIKKGTRSTCMTALAFIMRPERDTVKLVRNPRFWNKALNTERGKIA